MSQDNGCYLIHTLIEHNAQFNFSSFVGFGFALFKPSYIEGQVIQATGLRAGRSTVVVNLPMLTAEQISLFETFEVQWRQVGADIWQSTNTNITSTSVELPGELSDGSYELRIRTSGGSGGASVFTTPRRFYLRSRGMYSC